jgi:hypothetical protein
MTGIIKDRNKFFTFKAPESALCIAKPVFSIAGQQACAGGAESVSFPVPVYAVTFFKQFYYNQKY